jgi:hypothetical protein
MDVKDLKIERNRCDCHPETCSCDDWNLVYGGEVLARHLFRERLEKLLDVVIKPVQHERDDLLEALEKFVCCIETMKANGFETDWFDCAYVNQELGRSKKAIAKARSHNEK